MPKNISNHSNDIGEEVEDFINLGVVRNEKGEVLIVKREEEEKSEKDNSILIWSFPGGKQRLNESREECVKRKVSERTGYDVASIKQISLRMHLQFPVMIAYHLCRLVSPKPTIAKPAESYKIAEIRWVKPEEIRKLFTTDLDPGVAKELKI